MNLFVLYSITLSLTQSVTFVLAFAHSAFQFLLKMSSFHINKWSLPSFYLFFCLSDFLFICLSECMCFYLSYFGFLICQLLRSYGQFVNDLTFLFVRVQAVPSYNGVKYALIVFGGRASRAISLFLRTGKKILKLCQINAIRKMACLA